MTYLEAPKVLRLALLAIAGLVVSVAAFFLVLKLEEESALRRFEENAYPRLSAVEHSFRAADQALRSIVSLFDASDNVERDEFHAFVARILQDQPGLQALEWIPKVEFNRRTAYERIARANGYEDFRIVEKNDAGKMVPAGTRASYYPVFYLEPYAGNERALGFDLASNPTRRQALEEARDRGQTQATSRITLVQETGEQYGFLLFAPVYRNGGVPKAIGERRQKLEGFALGVFRIGDMVSVAADALGLKRQDPADIDVYLYDESAEESEQLLYVYHADEAKVAAPLSLTDALSGPHLRHVMEAAGRRWSVIARPVDPTFGVLASWQPWAALFVGLLLTGILFAFLRATLNRTALVQSRVDQRTAELTNANLQLQESQASVQAIVEAVVDGIITITAQGVIHAFNPAAERIFGYESTEVIGRNVKILMPAPYHDQHDGYLKAYLETGEAKVIGIGREVVGLRKDGTTFPMDLAVSEMAMARGRMFTGIVRDITERKKIESMKNEFVSTVSHELRTPLTSIMGSLGLVRSGVVGRLPEKAASMIDIAYKNSDRLVRLINDMLDVEKIESGSSQFQMQPLEVTALVAEAVESNAGYGKQYGVSFILTNPPQSTEVMGDHDKLLQVMANLLSNAAKFSPENGTVAVVVTPQNGTLRVAVTDHGPGIPENFQDRIFGKFAQADSSDTREKGGTGLGLSICKAIVERHDGRIGFATEAGKGTTFYFDLPVWEPATASLLPLAEGPRVLVCEDDPAVAKGPSFAPDLIILDVMMPGVDGPATLRELHHIPELAEVPVVFMTAKTQGHEVEMLKTHGAIDVIMKPFDPMTLTEQILGIWSRYHD